MPKNPKQKAAFLAFPKAADHVVGRQLAAGMAPGVMILILMRIDDAKK